MNIISCTCGVLLDKNKLKFAYDIYDKDGCVDLSVADWSDAVGDYVAKVDCPVCGASITEE